MELPLVLRLRDATRLDLGIPPWYRVAMGLMAGLIVAAMFAGEGAPSLIGWAFFAFVALAFFYEESWSFDTKAGRLSHRFGLIILAKTISVPLSEITGLRLVPWTRGTLPGSSEEKADDANTLAVSRGAQDGQANPKLLRAMHKKPFLALVCECESQSLLLNIVPARNGTKLRAMAERIARHCGKNLSEG